MPELPEVQTVLDTLAIKIIGQEILDVSVFYQPLIQNDVSSFCSLLIGQHFCRFLRRGKYLIFELDDYALISHLRMEGKYFLMPIGSKPAKHTHIIFHLSDLDLHYNDVRKFGRFELIPKMNDYLDFKNLGPEPLGEYFDHEYARSYLHNIKKPIKEVLLDQQFVAGIGNIYADEILYSIYIDPRTPCRNLNEEDVNNLVKSTKDILSDAIKAGGTTIRSFTSSLGVSGRFQLSLKIHTKTQCQVCRSDVKKVRVGGRTSYYCPVCQDYKQRIAITGTIGSGKSTVSEILRNKGFYVFDCDACNKTLLENGNAGYHRVKELFPDVFVDNELDKGLLADKIFHDPQAKKKLEEALHPLILNECFKEADAHSLFFAEVPLLFENQLQKCFDLSLLITLNKEIALNRLVSRGLSRKDAKARIANQMPVKDKIKLADDIMNNNGSIEELEQAIDRWLLLHEWK